MLGFIRHGWPEYIEKLPERARDFYQVRGKLSELHGLVMSGSRIAIPADMRGMILERLHDGHQGLIKCSERASQSVRWPKMSGDITTNMQPCASCRGNKNTQRKEP